MSVCACVCMKENEESYLVLYQRERERGKAFSNSHLFPQIPDYMALRLTYDHRPDSREEQVCVHGCGCGCECGVDLCGWELGK